VLEVVAARPDAVRDLEGLAGVEGVLYRIPHRLAVVWVDDVLAPDHVPGFERVSGVAGEPLDLAADELHRPAGVVLAAVHHPGEVADEGLVAAVALVERALGAALLDGVLHAVGEDGVLVGAGLFLEVVGDARRNRVAGDLLGALSGEEDERQVGVVLPDGFEELDAVAAGHVVVGDHAVDAVLGEVVEGVRGVGHRSDVEAAVDAFEVRAGEVPERAVVVHVQDANRPGCRSRPGGHTPHNEPFQQITTGSPPARIITTVH